MLMRRATAACILRGSQTKSILSRIQPVSEVATVSSTTCMCSNTAFLSITSGFCSATAFKFGSLRHWRNGKTRGFRRSLDEYWHKLRHANQWVHQLSPNHGHHHLQNSELQFHHFSCCHARHKPNWSIIRTEDPYPRIPHRKELVNYQKSSTCYQCCTSKGALLTRGLLLYWVVRPSDQSNTYAVSHLYVN